MTKNASLPVASTSAYLRRRIIGGAVGLCGLAMVGARADAQDVATAPTPQTKAVITKTIVATRAIHQEEDFKATPDRIYEALLDAKQFTAFSGGRKAEIDRTVGGTFSIFAGHIVGRNLELVPNRRIVQAWRVLPWPEGIYSIARFELVGRGSGTRIVFEHTGFPPELAEHLESGWNENYWTALQKYLG